MKYAKGNFENFHNHNCFVEERIIFFGSESGCDDDCGESGVDYASATKVMKNLLYLDQQANKKIYLHYSSPGGDWDRGIAIHDCILGLRSSVTMIGYGCVRSMGTIIMQACDERLLTPNCRFMIHDGTCGIYGTSEDVKRNADESEWTREKMHDIYYAKMKEKNPAMTVDAIATMCQHDCYMSGQEAVDIGLADKVIGGSYEL